MSKNQRMRCLLSSQNLTNVLHFFYCYPTIETSRSPQKGIQINGLYRHLYRTTRSWSRGPVISLRRLPPYPQIPKFMIPVLEVHPPGLEPEDSRSRVSGVDRHNRWATCGYINVLQYRQKMSIFDHFLIYFEKFSNFKQKFFKKN